MEIFTIGFTQTSARKFFERLKQAGIKRLVDVRLNNVSQLAGFAKRNDLEFFLNELCAAEYLHEPLLAHEFLGPQPPHARWLAYVQALLLTNEFAFVD